MGEVIDVVLQHGVGQNVAVQELRGIVEVVAQVEVALVSEVDFVAIGDVALPGEAGGVGLKGAGLLHLQKPTGLVHQLDHKALGGHVQPVDGLHGGGRDGGGLGIQIQPHQVFAAGVGDEIGGVLVEQRGVVNILRQQRLLEAGQIDHVKVLDAGGGIGAEIQHPIGVRRNDAVGAGRGDAQEEQAQREHQQKRTCSLHNDTLLKLVMV